MFSKTIFTCLEVVYLSFVFIRLASGLSFDRCPPTETAIAPDQSPFASVVWDPPKIVEADSNIAFSKDHTPGDYFPIGNTTVTYRAVNITDTAVIDSAVCRFVVRVLDVTPPVITQCPYPMSLTLPHGLLNTSISWMEPRAVDNSGKFELTSTHRPGDTFYQGDTQVTYTASDSSGNNATCMFNVSLFTMTAEPTTHPVTAEHNETISASATLTDSKNLTPSAILTQSGTTFQNMIPLWKGKVGHHPQKPLSSILPPKDETKMNGYDSFVNSPTMKNIDMFMHRNARVIEIACITFISLFVVAALILIAIYNKTIIQTLRLRHERKRTNFPSTSWEQCPQMDGMNDPLLLKEYNDYPRKKAGDGSLNNDKPTLQPGEILPLIAGGGSTRLNRPK